MADNLTTTDPAVSAHEPEDAPFITSVSSDRKKEYMEESEVSSADDETDDDNRSTDPEEDGPVKDADDDIHTDTDIFEEESDGESSLDSLSTGCYEELDYDAPLIRYVERLGLASPELEDGNHEDSSDMSNWSMDEYESSEDMEVANSDASKTEDAADTPPESDQSHPVIESDTRPTTPPPTFAMAESEKFKLLSYKKDMEYEEARWELKGTEEELSSLLKRVADLKSNVEGLEREKREAEDKVVSSFQKCGISPELYAEYEAFCSSLYPTYGLRGGFTVHTLKNHYGDYIQYDPEFSIFKEGVKDEMSYDDRNFRVEAQYLPRCYDPYLGDPSDHGDYFSVAFWPLKCPEPLTDNVKTWGDQYPDLYQMANDAVREENSEAAMEMLVRLPDMNAMLGGGWLFDYQPEPTLASHPIESMRWRFRSAHKIDSPVSTQGKRLRLQLMLQPEKISEAALEMTVV